MRILKVVRREANFTLSASGLWLLQVISQPVLFLFFFIKEKLIMDPLALISESQPLITH